MNINTPSPQEVIFFVRRRTLTYINEAHMETNNQKHTKKQFICIHVSNTKTNNPRHTKKRFFRIHASDTKITNRKHTKKRFLNIHVSDRKINNLKHTKKQFLRWPKGLSPHQKRKIHFDDGANLQWHSLNMNPSRIPQVGSSSYTGANLR